MVIEIGEKAPNFELVDTELKFRTLDEFKGKKVVISFFVAASSPVCEVELCTFRDKWNEISELGAQVIAISNDGPFFRCIIPAFLLPVYTQDRQILSDRFPRPSILILC